MPEIQGEGERERENNRRIATTKRVIAELNSVLWSKKIMIKTKKIIYKTIIESILLYGAETWTIRKANEKKCY